MKRLPGLLLVLCLMLGLCGCQFITKESIERDATALDDAALYEHSLELAGLLEEMLGSPEYFEMMGGSDRLGEVITPLMGSDLSAPESAYMAALPEDALPGLMSAAEVDLSGFSDSLQDFILRRMQSSVPAILNSQAGSEALAAASILTVSDAWPGIIEMGCYVLLMYPDSCPVMVSFSGKDTVISGTATLLLGEPLQDNSPDAVEELFGLLDIDGLYLKELEIDID